MLTTDLSPQRVLEAIPRDRKRAITERKLAESLRLSDALRATLAEYLEKFSRHGLTSNKAGKHWRRADGNLMIGLLRGTRSGHAFVIPEDPEQRAHGDLRIRPEWLGNALHGDIVIARLTGSGHRGREGAIETVLFRSNPTVVGRVVKQARETLVVPFDQRFLDSIRIAPADSRGAIEGDIVNVEITRSPARGHPPWGRVIEMLGREDTPGIDVEIIIRKHHLPHVFPDHVMREADLISDRISETDLSGRLDLRSTLTVTIDGESARDFDDAVSLETIASGGLRLGVHIADVSHYVTEGSGLDEEAYTRGTSVYFPERAIPMLPERLSTGICSLNPGVDRLTMSVLIDFAANGRQLGYHLTPSVIRSRERMTYTQVNEIIREAGNDDQTRKMLLRMHTLALECIARREQRGAIDFNLPEAEILFNDEGQIGGIVRCERNIAHRLIEEFMLIANETVARHLQALGVPSIYRIHEEPEPARVEEFAETAASFGHRFSIHGPIPQRGFQQLTRQIAGLPEERLLSYLMLRAMQRATYTFQNQGHFGLALDTYTHFTSPIRRYPDLIVHRILREVLVSGAGQASLEIGRRHSLKRVAGPVLDPEREDQLRRSLPDITRHSSDRERVADDAERELIEWRKVQFMADRVGDEFSGWITSISDNGFFVELADQFVEGHVHVSTLPEDIYFFEEKRHRLVGQRTGREFRLGDGVLVSVINVDQTRRRIDFGVVG